MPIQPGTALGAYQVKQLIGQGAMGSVYLARHEALDRTAAIKVMHALGDDPVAAARFRREGQAIARLRHPNVLTVYDYGEFEGTPYMVIEYVAGGSLAERLKGRGPLEATEALTLLGGIAAGLDYAHEMGVVHRDVKPANVLMGSRDAPVIADFGVARLEQQANMTASGVTTGTPLYMAPEQIAEGSEIGVPADIYAFTTVAYEVLTGRLPYETDRVMKLLVAKLQDDPTPPTLRNPSLPRKLDRILLRGLARQPDMRWTSCAALVEALAGVLQPEPELLAATQPMRRRVAPGWRKVGMVGAAGGCGHGPARRIRDPAKVHSATIHRRVPNRFARPSDRRQPQPGAGRVRRHLYRDRLRCERRFVHRHRLGRRLHQPAARLAHYLLRACTHNVGSDPTNCVQVPFTITAPAVAKAVAPAPRVVLSAP